MVNAASNSSQAMAPGSMVTLSGSNLGGASVILAGRPAPAVSVRDTQLTVVLPYGISANTTQQVIVSRGASISVPQPVIIAPAAPGIFTTDGNQGNVVDLNNKMIDPGNPATAGDSIIIYCTGLGEVDPPLAAGQTPPETPLSQTVNSVSVTIGGVDAQVTFSGLTPGSVGLYQVKAIVPAGANPGDHIPVVLTAAGQVSPAAMIAIH